MSNPGWERQNTAFIEGKPHGWIQWKGTDVCMDVHCQCGELGHIDADFAYYVGCKACGRVYMTNGHIELVLLDDDESKEAASAGRGVIWTDDE